MEVINPPEIPQYLHSRIKQDIKAHFERMYFDVGDIDLYTGVFTLSVKGTSITETATLWISTRPLTIQERVNISKFVKSYVVNVVYKDPTYSISYFHSKRFRR